jgi:hypothetical protein
MTTSDDNSLLITQNPQFILFSVLTFVVSFMKYVSEQYCVLVSIYNLLLVLVSIHINRINWPITNYTFY